MAHKKYKKVMYVCLYKVQQQLVQIHHFTFYINLFYRGKKKLKKELNKIKTVRIFYENKFANKSVTG